MTYESGNYEVFQENPVRIVVDENNEPWFCGLDIAKLLGYKAPNIAIQDTCKKRKIIPFYPLDLGKMKRLAFISKKEAIILIKKRLPNAEEYLNSLLNGKLPELNTKQCLKNYTLVDLEQTEQVIIKDGIQYKITVKKI